MLNISTMFIYTFLKRKKDYIWQKQEINVKYFYTYHISHITYIYIILHIYVYVEFLIWKLNKKTY